MTPAASGAITWQLPKSTNKIGTSLLLYYSWKSMHVFGGIGKILLSSIFWNTYFILILTIPGRGVDISYLSNKFAKKLPNTLTFSYFLSNIQRYVFNESLNFSSLQVGWLKSTIDYSTSTSLTNFYYSYLSFASVIYYSYIHILKFVKIVCMWFWYIFVFMIRFQT